MDIIQAIHQDHVEVMGFVNDLLLLAEREPSEKTAHLVENLCEAVRLHAKAEEAALYEICRHRSKELRDFALEGFEGHALLESELEKLAITRPGEDGQFKAILNVVKELLHHHAEIVEEQELLPKLRAHFTDEELEEMGAFMLDEKERIKDIPLISPILSEGLEVNPAV